MCKLHIEKYTWRLVWTFSQSCFSFKSSLNFPTTIVQTYVQEVPITLSVMYVIIEVLSFIDYKWASFHILGACPRESKSRITENCFKYRANINSQELN